MRILVALLLFVSVATSIRAAGFEDRFTVVLIDTNTEAKLGAFPLDRIHFAKALERAAIEGKIVIFGSDGPKLHSIETDAGPIKAHRYFILGLKSLHDRLAASQAGQAPATR